MPTRLKGFKRIVAVYAAIKHAQELSLEEAVAALRQVELRIEQQNSLVARTWTTGREALNIGAHEAWKLHEAQNQATERHTQTLVELRRKRVTLLSQADEIYRAGTLQLEQAENVLREMRSQLQVEQDRKAQQASDDRFLAQRWWQERASGSRLSDVNDTSGGIMEEPGRDDKRQRIDGTRIDEVTASIQTRA